MPTISPGVRDLILTTNSPSGIIMTYIRPDADSTDGSWVNESGSNVNLFASINEEVINDNNYIRSSDAPNGDVCKIRLSNFSTPVDEPLTISYRYKKSTDGEELNLTVRLLEGTTVIAEWANSNISSSFVTYANTLSTVEFLSIGDFDNLFIEFEANIHVGFGISPDNDNLVFNQSVPTLVIGGSDINISPGNDNLIFNQLVPTLVVGGSISISPDNDNLIFSQFVPSVVAGGDDELQLFRTINNAGVGAMPADAFWTVGHPFLAGEVPSGSIVTAELDGTSVPVQGIASSTHGDGSLAWTQLLIDLSGVAITAGSSKDLVLTTVAGSWSTTTSRTNADWAALAHTVEITNLTTTSTSGADMDGAGTWTATLDAGAGNIIEVYGQGPRGLWVKVMAPLVNGATTHRFLYAMMEYWVTQKAGGTLGPVAFRGPFIRNDAVFKTNPGTFTYDVAFKQGGSTVRSEIGVPHIAMSWMTLCALGGDMEWSASDPHIWVSQDYTKLRKAFPALPYRDGIVYVGATTGNVLNIPTTPITGINTGTGVFTVGQIDGLKGANSSRIGAVDFTATAMPTGLTADLGYWAVFLTGTTIQIYDTLAHALTAGATGKVIPSTSGTSVVARLCLAPTASAIIDQAMNAPGARADLSVITEWGASYIVGNTQIWQRNARVAAYAITSTPMCVINEKTWKVPSLLNGTGSYPTPTVLIGAGQSGTTFTDTYWAAGDGSFSTDIGGGSGPTGMGSPPNNWQLAINHFPNPSFVPWLLEGGAILREALYLRGSIAIGTVTYLGQRNFTVSATTYYAVGIMHTELRTDAWCMVAYVNAAYAAPDGSPEKEYFEKVIGSNAAACSAYVTYKGTNFSNLGLFIYTENDYPPEPQINDVPGMAMSQYGAGYLALSYAWADILVGDRVSEVGDIADFVGRGLDNLINVGCAYFVTNYTYGTMTSDAGGATPGTFISTVADIGFGPGNDMFFSYTNSSANISWAGGEDPWWTLLPDDKFRPQNYGSLASTAVSAATPFVDGTNYFITSVNTGAKTFTVSATSGGSSISATQTKSGSGGWLLPTGQSCPSTGSIANDESDPGAFMVIWMAAGALHAIRGSTGAAAAYDEVNGRMTADYDVTAQWAYTRTL